MNNKSKWVVFNPETFERIKTVTIEHQSNLRYFELDIFEATLKLSKLAAHDWDALNQSHLKGKSFKEKLKILGW